MLTFHIRTYGCQMNERDSEALACLLLRHGYRPAVGEDDADVILFNTCSVRDQAERKALGKIGLMRRLKRARPHLVVGVVGCMAQRRGATLLEQCPHLDFVLGTDQLHQLPDLIAAARAGHESRAETGVIPGIPPLPEAHEPGRVSAYVSVMRGCDQYCSYCVVPFVRGRERSRPIPDIVAEVRGLVTDGTREIVLLGQNITAYGLAELRHGHGLSPELSPFADLLRAVSAVDGLLRIRFTSPHPRFMNAAFIEAVATLPKVCKALHIPLQSGSDRILETMRRGYTLAEYLDRIRRLRAAVPHIAFSTDVIVGFPGETAADFQATRAAMDEAGFDMAYIFRYSPRTGTLAAGKYADDVPAAVKLERNKVLLADLERRAAESNRRHIGTVVEVLAEGPSPLRPERWTGRTDTNRTCNFEPTAGIRPGDVVPVTVTGATASALRGSVVPREPPGALEGGRLDRRGG